MTTLNKAIELYLVEASTSCEPSTIAHYKKRLRPFQRNLGSKDISKIKAKHVISLIDAQNKWPDGTLKAPDTIRSNVSVWEQFQQWMIKSKTRKKPITKEKIKKPSGRKRELLPTPEETRNIIACSPEDFRQVYRSLRLTGARPGELANATIPEIDQATSEIILYKHKTFKKTGKPRRIAVGHPSLIQIIALAIGTRTEGPIYLRSNGKKWTVPLLGAAFRKARDAAGARKGLVLYLTRHEHANALYLATNDIKTVMDALGHTQVGTTMRYTRVTPEKLKQNQQHFNENLEVQAAVASVHLDEPRFQVDTVSQG